MKLIHVFACLCLVGGASSFMSQMFGGGGFMGNRGSPSPTVSTTGRPAICSRAMCLNYTVIEKTQHYERRRYPTMSVVYTEDLPGMFAHFITYSRIRSYFRKAKNAEMVVMNLTYPVLKANNVSTAQMTIMVLPPSHQQAPPAPTSPHVKIDTLPAMDVLVRPVQTGMFASVPTQAIADFKASLPRGVTLASDASFIAEYDSAFKPFGREAEIWLIAAYPQRQPAQIYPYNPNYALDAYNSMDPAMVG